MNENSATKIEVLNEHFHKSMVEANLSRDEAMNLSITFLANTALNCDKGVGPKEVRELVRSLFGIDIDWDFQKML